VLSNWRMMVQAVAAVVENFQIQIQIFFIFFCVKKRTKVFKKGKP
jgi:hypothetical protein